MSEPQAKEPQSTLGDRLVIPGVTLFACMVVAIGAFERMPYGYYTFLRIVTCFAAVTLVASIEKGQWLILKAMLVGVALLFNPLLPVYMSRSNWFPIDIGTIILFLFALYPVSSSSKKPDAVRNAVILCEVCGQRLRIPRGKSLRVTCPICRHQFRYSPTSNDSSDAESVVDVKYTEFRK